MSLLDRLPGSASIPTLRQRLLRSLLVPLTVLAIAGVGADYMQARRLADESYDQVLASTAVGLASRLELERDGDLQAHFPAAPDVASRDALLYAVFNAQGRLVVGIPALWAIAHPRADMRLPYFHDEKLSGRPMRVATYAYAGPEGRGTIVVAEAPNKRLEASHRLMQSTAWTNLLTVIFTLGVVYFAVRHALRPLEALSQQFEQREPRDMTPLSMEGVPGEARALVLAANGLMQRLRESAQSQQAFVSNTAHQLRTPLAGLQTQLELQLGQAPPNEQHRVRALLRSTQKLSHLTHQLLALARSGPHALEAQPLRPMNLEDLFEDVASACLDQALARGIDLGFEPRPAQVSGSAWMLRELLLNLVHNAIAYTPEGGRVTVSCGMDATGHACLAVEDTGPGIPADLRTRVFERFYRAAADEAGTGLGLAIVKEIADRHGAEVSLSEGASGQGTRVDIRFAPPDEPSPR
jgi:two-component system sensor histidine kinase TctE